MKMNDLYKTPQSDLNKTLPEVNNSGMKQDLVPDGVAGWSWGAFMFNWLWAVFNKTWIGLLCIIPYIGLIFAIWLGIKGREMAWKNKKWDSLEHFNRVQRKWSLWSLLFFGIAIIGILAAIALPAYQQYVMRSHGG
jgi:hypothetical protein